ncbi:MAG: hypothetical protein ACR2H1_13880, partial [Limisphaerales bacterium]
MADLVRIGTKAGLRIHAAMLTDFDNLPVPSVLHLRSEHFVVIREKRGAFYNVYDTAAFGPRWLIATEIAEEASGCVLVSDVGVTQNGSSLAPLDITKAADYRGRCHGPLPYDHGDNPCPDGSCDCPPGGPGGGPNGKPGEQGCPSCGDLKGSAAPPGMPTWFVSEPFLNLWIEDTPLEYKPAFGPPVSVHLTSPTRGSGGLVSGSSTHGASFGFSSYPGAWFCSLLSFAELDSSENLVDLSLPTGGWGTFNFSPSNNVSDVLYRNNTWLEKTGSPGNITSLILHYPNGAYTTYGVCDTNVMPSYGLFYVSRMADSAGNETTFLYDTNFYLTNVTAADGTTFSFSFDYSYAFYNLPAVVTNITTSYGASVSFSYSGPYLISITDAQGITSQISYGGGGKQLVTPYGTTDFNTSADVNIGAGVFDRIVRITLPNGTQEFYGSMNTYTGTDWPDFTSGQIPANTPLNTLDTSNRSERNTFYWNAQQFAPYVTTSLYDFNWEAFNKSRIRHWLAATDFSYTHFDTLSIQQESSPDGSTNTQGQLTWYDCPGKPANVNYERGSQVMPSVVARVMPDGTTWYEYSQRNSVGKTTNVIEKWETGGNTFYRTNSYLYAANNVDLLAWTNAFGIRALSNVFNAYGQITTSYDALNQATSYTYDSTTRQLTSISRPTGLITTNIYNASHRLQSTTDLPINRTQSYTWSLGGNVATMTDERGMTVTKYWNGLNRLIGTLYPDGTTTTNLFTHDPYPSGTGGTEILDLTATKDRLGFWTYFDYDSLRRKIAETNANNVVTRWSYCDCGGVTSITNAAGTSVEQIVTLNYDYQGHVLSTLYADGYAVTNWF